MNENTIPTSEVLNRAADLIEEHGWGQGVETWRASAGQGLCLEGGLAAALGFEGQARLYDSCPAYAAVQEYLDNKYMYAFMWNDIEGRTADEVIEVLRAAAVIEAAKENAETREQVTA